MTDFDIEPRTHFAPHIFLFWTIYRWWVS